MVGVVRAAQPQPVGALPPQLAALNRTFPQRGRADRAGRAGRLPRPRVPEPRFSTRTPRPRSLSIRPSPCATTSSRPTATCCRPSGADHEDEKLAGHRRCVLTLTSLTAPGSRRSGQRRAAPWRLRLRASAPPCTTARCASQASPRTARRSTAAPGCAGTRPGCRAGMSLLSFGGRLLAGELTPRSGTHCRAGAGPHDRAVRPARQLRRPARRTPGAASG